MQVRTVGTGRGTTDWFQIGKGVGQGSILSPCLFNLYAECTMRNALLEELKLESRLPGEISVTSAMHMIPPRGTKEPSDEVKVESEKVGLKLNIQKTKIMASDPIASWEIDG